MLCFPRTQWACNLAARPLLSHADTGDFYVAATVYIGDPSCGSAGINTSAVQFICSGGCIGCGPTLVPSTMITDDASGSSRD